MTDTSSRGLVVRGMSCQRTALASGVARSAALAVHDCGRASLDDAALHSVTRSASGSSPPQHATR